MLFLSFVFIFFVSLTIHYISFLSVNQFGKGGNDATQQEIENKVQEILADWEPGDEGIQRVYWYSGSTVQGPGNLNISREDMMANLDKHGTLLWTAEDGVVYNP